MNRPWIGVRLLVVALGCATIACAPSDRAVSPSGSPATSPGASASALSSAGPATAAASPIEGTADIPIELQVTCTGSATEIGTPRVRARPDGFHIRFTNTSGGALPFGIDDASGLPMLGDEVPAEGGAFVYALGIGAYRVSCGGAPTAFAVVDPDGIYTSTELGCGNGSGTTGTLDYGQEARGPRGSPLDVARMELRGLEPGDLVERAGYPASDGDRLVRVVRDGQVVAVLAYADDGHGGWLIGTTRTCPGSRITVEAP